MYLWLKVPQQATGLNQKWFSSHNPSHMIANPTPSLIDDNHYWLHFNELHTQKAIKRSVLINILTGQQTVFNKKFMVWIPWCMEFTSTKPKKMKGTGWLNFCYLSNFNSSKRKNSFDVTTVSMCTPQQEFMADLSEGENRTKIVRHTHCAQGVKLGAKNQQIRKF